jgi:hypothetical protein
LKIPVRSALEPVRHFRVAIYPPTYGHVIIKEGFAQNVKLSHYGEPSGEIRMPIPVMLVWIVARFV